MQSVLPFKMGQDAALIVVDSAFEMQGKRNWKQHYSWAYRLIQIDLSNVQEHHRKIHKTDSFELFFLRFMSSELSISS